MSQDTAMNGYNTFSERGYAGSRSTLYALHDIAEMIAHHDAARYASHTDIEEYRRMLTVSEFQVEDDAAAAVESVDWALDFDGEWQHGD